MCDVDVGNLVLRCLQSHRSTQALSTLLSTQALLSATIRLLFKLSDSTLSVIFVLDMFPGFRCYNNRGGEGDVMWIKASDIPTDAFFHNIPPKHNLANLGSPHHIK